jgi:hypothetical protein
MQQQQGVTRLLQLQLLRRRLQQPQQQPLQQQLTARVAAAASW